MCTRKFIRTSLVLVVVIIFLFAVYQRNIVNPAENTWERFFFGPAEEDVVLDTVLYGDVRKQYSVRNPKNVDIAKLSGELLDIEPATDPMNISAKCSKETFLTVLVISAPRNYLRRQFIRDTWANSYLEDIRLLKVPKLLSRFGRSIPLKDMFKVVFVMGRTEDGTHMKDVYEEARTNKDIVFGDMIESYRNLTIKTRLAIKWAYFECNTKYVLKTDDDVFVNNVMIVEWLKDMPRNNFYTGFCNFGSPVVRNPESKWYISMDDYAGDSYPGYCLGGGYLMSNDVLGKVISASYGRKLFPMEDLYIGLIIDTMSEVVIKDARQHFDLLFVGRSKDCDLKDLFLAHQVFGPKLVDLIKRSRKALSNCL